MRAADCLHHNLRKEFRRFLILPTLLLLIPGLVLSQFDERLDSGNKTVLGVRNIALKKGAESLLAGNYEEGVRLTHLGLTQAIGTREEEVALSNLCAGYMRLGKYTTALQYCNVLLTRNDRSWRAYNNRAVIYMQTKQWDKAAADLAKGEALNANARTMKLARAMYMDAVHPVVQEIEVDDSDNQVAADRDAN